MTAAKQLQEKRSQEIALRLLAQGLSIESIAQATDVPISKLNIMKKAIKLKIDH